MKITLLGGNGFIGDYLAAKLKKQNGCELRVVGLASQASNDYIQMDLSRPNERLRPLIDWSDTVVILTRDDIKIIDNLLATLTAREHPIKIVYLSTLLVYPDSDLPQDENSPLEPRTDYEELKCVEERKLLWLMAENSFCKLCIVRMANVYGDIKNRGVINSLFQAILTSALFEINSPGDSTRDYIFIEDAAELLAFLVLWPQNLSHEIVNICNGRAYSVQEIKQIAEMITGVKINTVSGPSVLEKKKIIGDNKKILSLSGYRMKHDLRQGLKKTLHSYKKYFNLEV
ncbi:MAG: NAD-dependent epimerase/dehydratase [Candidatus Magasanikbacteria bacterium GW2011_GWC2_41_17]|uniref:NAD-dependent epimerase/dehydratase n=2 Tax=Candidatus Magasanikiibacteriota TaxID=1752731 RepID=A0A0G0WLG3_9BACT|nr:MAG: NAD-dependent epimerase/dehydratase [Candidatus Magasanikbacteria bacterium GW2011_GWC2_41_17]KKS13630.1 MAG: NAD-dependent epimerase/dehydratase [Candidatus Magasanikbacteria bacterium GW2011_GWA2_41_55]